MRSKVFVVWLGLVVMTLAIPGAALAQFGLMFELSDWQGQYNGEVIEVLSGDIETLYIHLYDPYPRWWHVDGPPELHWEFLPGETEPEGDIQVLQWHMGVSMEIWPSEWYPFVTIQVTGTPSTTFQIFGVVPLAGVDPGEETSMPVWKHITPEPSSMLALGTGLFAFGGLLLRRRRC